MFHLLTHSRVQAGVRETLPDRYGHVKLGDVIVGIDDMPIQAV